MQTSEYKQFKELLIGVMSFYRQTVSNFTLDVWWRALQDYDIAAISKAFDRHLMIPDDKRAGSFAPMPSDIVKMLQGSTQDAAFAAWAKVDKAVRSVGGYQSVVFDDPLIHRVIYDMGGWVGLCQKSEDEWAFVAREFENRYRGFKSRGEVPEYPPTLIGVSEASNSRGGFRSPTPILIGAIDRAMLVMKGGTDKPMIGLTQLSDVYVSTVEKFGRIEKAA